MTRRVLYVAHCLRPTEEEIATVHSELYVSRGYETLNDVQRRHVLIEATIENAVRARTWRNWLRATFADVTFVAPWIGDLLVGDDYSERGLRDNCALIAKLDGIVLCGPRIDEDMRTEIETYDTRTPIRRTREVYDLTALGARPPSAGPSAEFALMSFDMFMDGLRYETEAGLYGATLYPEGG